MIIGLSILLIESDLNYSKVLETALSGVGYHVESIKTGLQFALLYEKSHYDIVITEYDLPDIKGDELLTSIKQNHTMSVLGIGCKWECMRLLKAGAVRCLEKPFGIDALIDEIENVYRAADHVV